MFSHAIRYLMIKAIFISTTSPLADWSALAKDVISDVNGRFSAFLQIYLMYIQKKSAALIKKWAQQQQNNLQYHSPYLCIHHHLSFRHGLHVSPLDTWKSLSWWNIFSMTFKIIYILKEKSNDCANICILREWRRSRNRLWVNVHSRCTAFWLN